MASLLKQRITILDIHKKIKARKRLVTIIKLINKDLNEEDNLNKKDSKDNILFKTIKLSSNKKPLSDNSNNEKLKLSFSPPLYRSQYIPPGK